MPSLNLINFFIFQLSWFCCAYLRDESLAVLIALLGLHFYLSTQRQRDMKLLFIVVPLGICFDLLLSVMGVIHFQSAYFFPPWLIGLWCVFALSVAYSFAWLIPFNSMAKIGIGSVAGALSYYAAGEIGALEIMAPMSLSLFYVALIWGFLLPVIFLLYTRYVLIN